MNKRHSFAIKSLFVFSVLLSPHFVRGELLKLGSISASPVAETRKFWPLASYLARQLQSEGIDEGKVLVAESIPVMAAYLQTREVDLYIDSLYPTMGVSRLSGSKLLLRRWKMGKSDYRSVIFARKDSSITRLEDLKGKMIAFEEPFASTGYFFPKMTLLEKGLRLTPKLQGSDPVRPDEVGYIFSRGDSNTVLLVLNKATAAGATDDQKYLTLAKHLDTFNIIHETISIPRQIVSYRADLPAKLVSKIKTVLLHMQYTEEGRQALQAFENTTKFDEITARDVNLVAEFRKQVDAELKLQR